MSLQGRSMMTMSRKQQEGSMVIQSREELGGTEFIYNHGDTMTEKNGEGFNRT